LLKKKLKPVRNKYDYIIVDTPPAMETPTMNAIIASDEVIVVVDCGYFAMYGLTDLMTEIAEAREAHDKTDLVIHGLLNMYSKNQIIDNQIKKEIFNFFGDLMLQTIIHKNVRLTEASANNQPIIEFDRAANGYFDFLKMTKELIGDGQEESRESSGETKTDSRIQAADTGTGN
jgi:chromosome partitioning protein